MSDTPTYSSCTATTNLYVWGNDLPQGAGGVGGLLAVIPGAQGFRPASHPCHDANGNVTEYVDGNGVTAAHYAYDAYGNTTVKSGPVADDFNFRFSTKYYDAETGNYYYIKRPYSPALGRFISEDPIGIQGGLNLYGFCGNDPINAYDMLGMWKIKREGLPWATARAESGDTFDSLAKLLKLDTSDYKIWAHTEDEYPDLCYKDYYIPNTVYYHHGDNEKGWWFDPFPSLLDTFRSQNHKSAVNDRATGFKVVWIEQGVSSGDVLAALGDEYLYQYIFSGHGYQGAGKILLHNNKYLDPRKRFTKYGITLLVLNACWTADRPRDITGCETPYVPWEQNVATRGLFIGYKGETTHWNSFLNWRTVRGTNKGRANQ